MAHFYDYMYGLAGRTIRIDLTKMKYVIEPSENYAKFIGGTGAGSFSTN